MQCTADSVVVSGKYIEDEMEAFEEQKKEKEIYIKKRYYKAILKTKYMRWFSIEWS